MQSTCEFMFQVQLKYLQAEDSEDFLMFCSVPMCGFARMTSEPSLKSGNSNGFLMITVNVSVLAHLMTDAGTFKAALRRTTNLQLDIIFLTEKRELT